MATTSKTRVERDTFGPIEVPADKLWGAQTQRSLQNFDISGEHQPREIIRALAQTTIPHDRLINVNFPAIPLAQVKGLKLCSQGRRRLDDNLDRRVDPQGRPYIWIGGQRTVPFSEQPESDLQKIREQAYREGMKALRISGAMKVAAGYTTIEEVLKTAPPAVEAAS